MSSLKADYLQRLEATRLENGTLPNEETKAVEETKKNKKQKDERKKFLLYNVFKKEALKDKKDAEKKSAKKEFAMEVLISTITEEFKDLLL